jgi:hypothetical protein
LPGCRIDAATILNPQIGVRVEIAAHRTHEGPAISGPVCISFPATGSGFLNVVIVWQPWRFSGYIS